MYSPLDASRKEIRLLHVHPGAWNDEVECHLETVSLNDNPKFHAISYVWGDPNITLPITIDGEPLTITRNLCNGLQRLRKTEETLIIYADAACINQSDVDERSEQVQLMGEIYSSAQEVFIWLGYGRVSQAPLQRPNVVHFAGGDSDMNTVDAYFERAQSVDQQNDEVAETEDVLGLFVYLRLRAMDKHLHEIPFFTLKENRLHTKQVWAAVVRAAKTLQSNPWWTRIWVVQETVLARHANVVYCNITIPWTRITTAAKLTAVHGSLCCNVLESSLANRHIMIMSTLAMTIDCGVGVLMRIRQKKGKLSLGDIMRRTSMLDATDVRDKVFAVLGLVTDWQGNPPTVPDYNLPPKEIFIQAIISDIQGTSSMRALIGTTMSGIFGIPSWATETSLKPQIDSISAQLRFTRSSAYCAAGDARASIERQGDVLIVDAFKPSQAVSRLGPLEWSPDTSGQTVDNYIKACQHIAKTEQKTRLLYPGKKSIQEAFWRTTTNDIRGWYASEEMVKSSHTWSSQRFGDTNVASIGAKFLSYLESRLKSNKELRTELMDDFGLVSLFGDCWYSANWRRRFFITEDGHMGLGPPEMLPGDTIAILLGGSVPFCLRTVQDAPKDHYTLVGDTYVHDLMDGEGVPPNWEDHVVKIHLH